jgi:hypothetical protein
MADEAEDDEPSFAVGALPVAAFEEPTIIEEVLEIQLDDRAIIDVVYLVDLTAYVPGVALNDGEGEDVDAFPVGDLPVAAFDEPGVGAAPITLRFSDRGWTSEPDDDPPDTHWESRVTEPLSVLRSLPITPDADSRVLMQLGQMTLINSDAALDDTVRTGAMDGRPISVKIGAPHVRRAEFQTMIDCTAGNWRLADNGAVVLDMRDGAWEMDAPAQANLYGGTGGLDGTGELEGRPKPLAFGACLNVPPVLIDPEALIYQVHDGAIDAVTAVYDRGLALTFEANVADISAGIVSAGHFKVQRSGGYIRLGSVPTGIVTADIRGDKAWGVYVSSAPKIAFRIAHDRGGLPDSRFALTTIEALHNRQPAPIGIYQGPEVATLGDLLNAALGGINAWWGPNRFNQFEFGRVDRPDAQPRWFIDADDILEFSLLEPPATISPPVWRMRVGYQRNWTPQLTDLAAGVAPDRRQFLANEYRYATSSDISLTVAHRRAQDVTRPALFANKADAEAEALRERLLYSGDLQLGRARLKHQGFLVPLNSTGQVTFPRYGLASGRNAIAVGQSITASRNESTIDILF